MGPLERLPRLHPSLSLPSLCHLNSSISQFHRHLDPPRIRKYPSSTLLSPLLEHRSSTSIDRETLDSEAQLAPSQDEVDGKLTAHLPKGDPGRICSLCQHGIPISVIPYHFPKTAPAALAALNPHIQSSSSPRAFCHACWVWIHNLSLCWTCGDTVSRHEERVSFGWCWWHWACVSCLFCRVCLFRFFIVDLV
jgi:hypothetical protein